MSFVFFEMFFFIFYQFEYLFSSPEISKAIQRNINLFSQLIVPHTQYAKCIQQTHYRLTLQLNIRDLTFTSLECDARGSRFRSFDDLDYSLELLRQYCFVFSFHYCFIIRVIGTCRHIQKYHSCHAQLRKEVWTFGSANHSQKGFGLRPEINNLHHSITYGPRRA